MKLFAFIVVASICSTSFASSKVDSTFFRNVFKSSTQNKLSEQDFNKLVYSIPPELFSEILETNERARSCGSLADQLLCQRNLNFNKFTANDLYRDSLRQPKAFVNLVKLESKLQENELLIVVVPGIFGEFIDQPAFGDILSNQNSLFAKEWQHAVQKNISQPYAKDTQELLSRISPVNPTGRGLVSINHLIQAASVDRDGKPLYKLALFNTDGMSLETLGDNESRAKIFNSRLEKIFLNLGYTPKNIAFVGYSRGANIALDMLSQAQSQNKPWLTNVRGLVSLGGVVFGSGLADEANFDVNSVAFKQIFAIRKLVDMLQETKATNNTLQNVSILTANNFAWMEFLAKVGSLQKINLRELTRSIEKLKENGIVHTDPSFVLELILLQAKQFGFEFSLKTFNPNFPDYSLNIKRFKKLINAVLTGVYELSTTARINWWKSHQVPIDIKYYSIAATMADPKSGLINNRIGFNAPSADDMILIGNWQSYSKLSFHPRYLGSELNDSQVAVAKTIFWPDVIAQLNAKNADLQSTHLALFATHHWGLALPRVNKTNATAVQKGTVLALNPFPRAELLKSLAIAITEDSH